MSQVLADICNEVIGEDESLTVRAIQRMEQLDKVPTSRLVKLSDKL